MFSFGNASSNAPETPDRQQKRNSNPFSLLASHPSTTPLGLPPSSAQTHASTTPLGPPPSSVKALYDAPVYNTAIPFPHSSFGNQSYGSSVPYPSGRNGRAAFNGDAYGMDEDADRMSYSQHGVGSGIDLDLTGVNVSAIARSMSSTAPKIIESGSMILQTESVISALYEDKSGAYESQLLLPTSPSESVSALIKIWERDMQDILPRELGEIDSADPITKAVLLSSLQLAIHHPELETISKGRSVSVRGSPKPLPQTLVEWLNTKFLSHKSDLDRLLQYDPNPTAAEEFWDSALTFLAHGDVSGVVRLLQAADFSFAASAAYDGTEDEGYQGAQLGNVQRVVNRMIQVLSSCPSVQSGDWDTTSPEWSFFRKRVNQAMIDLEHFANGPGTVTNLGMSNQSLSNSLALSTSMTENKVPRTIYENIKFLYSQLLGNKSEIVASSTSWVDATVGIAIWSDNGEADAMINSQNPKRTSLNESTQEQRWNKKHETHTEKLRSAFEYVLKEHSDSELQIQTISEVEVGLACIFSGDNKGALGILSGWTLTIGSAVAEIAALGGWLEPGGLSNRLIGAFDESDLLVLSHGLDSDAKLSRDTILVAYADLLALWHGLIEDQSLQSTITGWQLAVQILSRLANRSHSRSRITEVLGRLRLETRADLDDATELCTNLGLEEQVKILSERYADILLEKARDYGEIMLLYARAQNDMKLTKLLNSLVSLSLTHSMAYPKQADLDAALKALVSEPKQTLAGIARIDPEAAALLSRRMSGYAMVRTFYDLRDQDLSEPAGEKHHRNPIAQRKQALSTLVAIIESAADSVHGGLYDRSIESVVEVESLMVVLGESLPFLDPTPHQVVTVPQAFVILRAVEDLTTVASAIYDKCNQCLKATIRHAYDSTLLVPSTILKRGTSDLTTSSQFSLISSGDLISQSNSSVEGSGVLVDSGIKRVWDWRKGFDESTDGAILITVLRSQLAKLIAKQWAQGI